MLGAFGQTMTITKLPMEYAVALGASFMVYIVLQYGPVLSFFFLFGDFASSLTVWGKGTAKSMEVKRKNGLLLKRMHATETLQDCKRFQIALQKAADLFSQHIFSITATLLFGIICTTYRAISFFMGTRLVQTTWIFVCMVIGYLGCTAVMWIQIIYLGFTAEYVREAVIYLQQEVTILDLDHLEKAKVDKSEDQTQAHHINKLKALRKEIIFQLSLFDGFSAMGFYTMNKSILSSLFSHFVTYLIILLQFRTGEK